MKINIIENKKLSSKSEQNLKSFIDNWIDKYWYEYLTEEIIGPDDIVQPQRKYQNKQEAKDSLLKTFQNTIFDIEIDSLIDDIDIVGSPDKGLSMYLKIYFDIAPNVVDYDSFIDNYGDLSLFEIRVSDHKPNKYTGFDKNIIVKGKSINQILPKIQTYVNNRIDRIKRSINEFNNKYEGVVNNGF